MKRLFVFLLALMFIASPVFGAELVKLQWDANTETDLAGYTLYIGTAPGVYTQQFKLPLNVLDPANPWWEVDVGTAYDGKTAYFAVTASDTSDNESGHSNEVSKDIADTTPPAVPVNLQLAP